MECCRPVLDADSFAAVHPDDADALHNPEGISRLAHKFLSGSWLLHKWPRKCNSKAHTAPPCSASAMQPSLHGMTRGTSTSPSRWSRSSRSCREYRNKDTTRELHKMKLRNGWSSLNTTSSESFWQTTTPLSWCCTMSPLRLVRTPLTCYYHRHVRPKRCDYVGKATTG